MNEYLQCVVQNLTLDDLKLLSTLHEHDATTKFKSVTNKYVIENSELTPAKYQKSLHRLLGNCFVENDIGGKEHRVFITIYGCYAIEKSIEGVDVN